MERSEITEKILERKDVLFDDFKSIKVNRSFFSIYYNLVCYSSGLIQLLKSFISIFYNRKVIIPSGEIFVSNFLTRKEHIELYSLMLRNVKDYGTLSLSKPFPSLLKFRHIKYAFKNVWKNNKLVANSFQKWTIFFSLINHTKQIEIILKLSHNPKLFISFSDSTPFENILAQVFKRRGAITCTMQHGLITDFDSSQNRPNIIPYCGFVSDYWLVWGDGTKEEISSYVDAEKIVVIGNPKYSNIKDSSLGSEITLFLSGRRSETSNRKLLDVVNSLGIKVVLKLHPSDSEKNYEKIIENGSYIISKLPAEELIRNSKICICPAESTIYLEGLSLGVPFLRYQDGTMFLVAGRDDIFTDSETLLKKFNEYPPQLLSEASKECLKWGEYYMANSDKDVSRLYGDFLNNL